MVRAAEKAGYKEKTGAALERQEIGRIGDARARTDRYVRGGWRARAGGGEVWEVVGRAQGVGRAGDG